MEFCLFDVRFYFYAASLYGEPRQVIMENGISATFAIIREKLSR